MSLEQSLTIIKPDAVAKNHVGEILGRYEKQGLRIAALKLLRFSRHDVERLYGSHRGQPYYADLLEFMSSGPSVVAVLEGEGAIAKTRAVMGSTNPALAAPGTIRADFGTATNRNAVHGSDAPETARHEITCCFAPEEIFSEGGATPSGYRYQPTGT